MRSRIAVTSLSGFARRDLELPLAVRLLAEDVDAALEKVAGVGLDGRLAALLLAVGKAFLRRDLAHERGLRRLPLDCRPFGRLIQYFHHGSAECFQLLTRQPRDRRVLEAAHVERPCRAHYDHQRQRENCPIHGRHPLCARHYPLDSKQASSTKLQAPTLKQAPTYKQAPNSKHRLTNKHQTPSTKSQTSVWNLELENCNLFEI